MKNNYTSHSVHRFQSFQSVNSLINFLSHAPILKKFYHDDLVEEYEAKEGLMLALDSIDFLKKLGKKILYLLIILGICITNYKDIEDIFSISIKNFGYTFLLLTVFGSLGLRAILQFDDEAYDSVILMKANARDYALSHVNKYILLEYITFAIAFIPIHIYLKIPYLKCLILLIGYLSLHIFLEALTILHYTKNDYIAKNKKNRLILLIIIGIISLALIILKYFINFSDDIAALISVLLCPFGIWGYLYLFRYESYKKLYRYNISTISAKINKDIVKVGNTVVNVDNSKLNNTTIETSKTGYAYVMDVFMKRYRKTYRIAFWIRIAIILAAMVAILIALYFGKDVLNNFELDETLFMIAKILILGIYLIARINKQFVLNCFLQIDRYLINYHFFRRSSDIAKNFLLRIKPMAYLTLIPTGLISLIMLFLSVFFSKLSIEDIIVLTLFPIVLGTFYIIYNLAAYYLLQPFSFDGKIINKFYSIFDGIIYIITYCAYYIQFELSAFILTIVTVVLFIISVALFILVIKRSPKQFRVR